jgi:hypothetical protein
LASAPFRPFLVERGLLVHPEHGVSITLTDCDERAEEEGAADGWDVAAKFAAGMLPAIFHPGDPALALVLAPEHVAGLRELVEGLPAAVLAAEDALGWTYQYWRGAEKRVGAASRNSADNSAAVNSSEVLPTASTASAKRLPMLVMRRRAGCQRRGAR